jgi:hypothetical protein
MQGQQYMQAVHAGPAVHVGPAVHTGNICRYMQRQQYIQALFAGTCSTSSTCRQKLQGQWYMQQVHVLHHPPSSYEVPVQAAHNTRHQWHRQQFTHSQGHLQCVIAMCTAGSILQQAM